MGEKLESIPAPIHHALFCVRERNINDYKAVARQVLERVEGFLFKNPSRLFSWANDDQNGLRITNTPGRNILLIVETPVIIPHAYDVFSIISVALKRWQTNIIPKILIDRDLSYSLKRVSPKPLLRTTGEADQICENPEGILELEQRALESGIEICTISHLTLRADIERFLAQIPQPEEDLALPPQLNHLIID